MLISTLEELRLFSPANAIDNIESLAGFINSSEHDFLQDKLGNALYESLNAYYASTIRNNVEEYINQMIQGENVPAYAQLLYTAQKVVTYDALARAVSVQAISVNGVGVNVASADDYKTADSSLIADYKKACIKEAHSAINELLVLLEGWTQKAGYLSEEERESEEFVEIAELWRGSRYFYLAAQLIIPSASVLQEYMNIYDSREKFIQLLPDIRYVQEDILAPIFGEDFLDYIVDVVTKGTSEKLLLRIIHNLRKVATRHLEYRITKQADARKETAYNEAVKLTDRLIEYLQVHQNDMTGDLQTAFATSPLYKTVEQKLNPKTPLFENNASDSVMFATPGLK